MGIEFHRIWREQIAAVPNLRREFGESVAFDYIIGEKLMLFAETAERQPAFTQELPSFVAALRGLFGPAVLRRELDRLARQMDADAADLDLVTHEEDEDWLIEAPETASARWARFAHLRSLLTASQPGTARPSRFGQACGESLEPCRTRVSYAEAGEPHFAGVA